MRFTFFLGVDYWIPIYSRGRQYAEPSAGRSNLSCERTKRPRGDATISKLELVSAPEVFD
jgi:hypothetical protein